VKAIEANIKLNVPLSSLHDSETILLHFEESVACRSLYNPEWTKINLIVTDRQIIINPNIFSYVNKNNAGSCNIFALPFGMVDNL
jgi:hypothetical protein